MDRRTTRRHDQAGQGLTEYAFILTLVAIVMILILIALGQQVDNLYSNVSNGLNY